jgi:hypothetical protein
VQFANQRRRTIPTGTREEIYGLEGSEPLTKRLDDPESGLT